MASTGMPQDGATPDHERELIEAAECEAAGWDRGNDGWRKASSASLPQSFPGYEIIRGLHRGGQGVVYEAIQLSTHRTVALKVLLEGPFASERSKLRFEREVQLVAQLQHPHIVAVHDSGIVDGYHYLAMDYVRGQPLDTHVRLAQLSVRDVVRLFSDICSAVSYAHQHGIIHRDLKPSNILVGEDGRPQLLDFGLAKEIHQDAEATRRAPATLTGQILGTLAYMAPEQTTGDVGAVDTRTDVYALGVILYELLSGRKPYPTNVELATALRNIREAAPTRPSRLRQDVNAELDAVVLKAMHKEKERRYGSAAEFAADLRAYLDGRPVSAKSDSSFYVLRKLAARHYFHTLVILSLVAAIVGFGGIAFQTLLREKKASTHLLTINRQFETQNRSLTISVEQANARQQEQALGWFLLEWHAGRVDAARSIQRLMRPDSPEFAATEFLLDESRTLEELRAEIPAGAEALVLFIAGERHLKAGRVEEAREAFARYVEQFRGVWRPLAEARLDQLGSGTRPDGVPVSGRPVR